MTYYTKFKKFYHLKFFKHSTPTYKKNRTALGLFTFTS